MEQIFALFRHRYVFGGSDIKFFVFGGAIKFAASEKCSQKVFFLSNAETEANENRASFSACVSVTDYISTSKSGFRRPGRK